MIETELFVGFELIPSMKRELLALSDAQKALYIDHDEASLTQIEIEGSLFMGKFSSETLELDALELLINNLKSMAAKLFNDTEIQEEQIVVLPLSKKLECS